MTFAEYDGTKKILKRKNIGIALMGIGHPVIGELGGYGGLLKRVKRSLMTFPDAHYPSRLRNI